MRAQIVIVLVALGAASAAADVPDATLRAVKDRVVRLELDDGGAAVEGQLVGFEPATVTIASRGTREVVSMPRAHLARVTLIDDGVPGDRARMLGLHSSLLGTVVVDAERGRMRAFFSTSLLLPLITLSGESTWFAAAFGAGLSWPMSETSRWRIDVFGEVVPFHTTSFYTYLGFGVGGGFHYTSASGFTLGFTFPVIGFATRLGSSPYGYDPSFRYNDSLAYYYVGALAGMPLLTFGYRFATNR